jgi:SAM-dependent methyltransferase
MFRSGHRKSAPRVVGGKTRRKNRTARTQTYFNTPRATPVIDRFRPGEGFRHVLTRQDIREFIELLPDWQHLSQGLRAVILAPGDLTCYGWYRHTGIIALCAWPRDLWCRWTPRSERDRPFFDRLRVSMQYDEDWNLIARWTDSTIRAFMLLDVFLHELGHHHDRMHTRSKRGCARGEGYAERYAKRHGNLLWNRYIERFGLPWADEPRTLIS